MLIAENVKSIKMYKLEKKNLLTIRSARGNHCLSCQVTPFLALSFPYILPPCLAWCWQPHSLQTCHALWGVP